MILIVFLLLIIALIVFIVASFYLYKKRKENRIIRSTLHKKNYNLLRGPNQWSSHPLLTIQSTTSTHNKINNEIQKVFHLLKDIGYPTQGWGKQKISSEPDKWVHYLEYDRNEESPVWKALDMVVVQGSVDTHQLEELYSETRLGISTACIVQAAIQNSLPVSRVTTDNFLVLSYGTHQKRIMATVTSLTPHISVYITQDKQLTTFFLSKMGIPVPRGKIVTSEKDACDTFQHHFHQEDVVIKPLDGHQGKGIVIRPQSMNEIARAYSFAMSHSSKEVLMEQYIEGKDYRVLVVNHKVITVSHRQPPTIVGDGRSSIDQLIDRLNQDPLRKVGHNGYLTQVEKDEQLREEVKTQGYSSLSSIPVRDQVVYLRRQPNLSTGGTATTIKLDTIHPLNLYIFRVASKIIRLDIAGIDVVSKDLSVPLTRQGAIIEVNTAPGLRMHIPDNKNNKTVGSSILHYLFPNPQKKIPIIAITGTNGKTTTVFLVSHILQQVYSTVGSVTTHGICFNNKVIRSCDCSGPQSARAVLHHPRVDAVVLEVARGGIIREGLGYEESTIGVILNIGRGDHLGMDHILTKEDIFRVKSTVMRTISSNGIAIINASDTLLKHKIPPLLSTSHIIWYSMDPSTIPTNASRSVIFRQQRVCIMENNRVLFDMNVTQVPCTHQGTFMFQIENILASIAVAWSMKIPFSVLQESLSTFVPPVGRGHLLVYPFANILLDYAHNIDAMERILPPFQSLSSSSPSSSIIMFGAPGDRRDEDILLLIQKINENCQVLLLFEDEKLRRGRKKGDLLSLMMQKIDKKKGKNAYLFHSEGDAVRYALSLLKSQKETKKSSKLNILFLLDNVKQYQPLIIDFLKAL